MSENIIPTKTVAKPAAKRIPVARKRVASKIVVAKPVKKIKKEKKVEEKVKVVRDSFTMPQTDYNLISEIKQKALKAGLHVKKSELLRAGLQALAKLSTAQLKQTVSNLEKIKTGRPKKV
jgi:hypothetical protein